MITVASIKALVAAHYGVAMRELDGPSKSPRIAHPRQVSMCLARQFTRHSLQRIAELHQRADHTTVIHALRSVEHRKRRNSKLVCDIEELADRIEKDKGLFHTASPLFVARSIGVPSAHGRIAA